MKWTPFLSMPQESKIANSLLTTVKGADAGFVQISVGGIMTD